MKILLCLLLSFLGLALSETYDDGVVVLSGETFGSSLQSYKYAMVLFYTPDNLTPSIADYHKAAQTINQLYPGIKLCKLDTTNNEGLATTYGNGDQMAIRFWKKGVIDPISYDALIEEETIVNWILQEIDRSIPEVFTVEEAEKMISEDQYVGFYLGPIWTDNYVQFLNFTTFIDEETIVKFIKSDTDEVKAKYNASDSDVFLFSRDNGQELNPLKNDFGVDNMKRFVKLSKDPVVMTMDYGLAKRIDRGTIDVVFIVLGDNETAREDFHKVAAYHRGNISFVETSVNDDYGANILRMYGAKEKHVPMVGILDNSDNQRKYKLNREVNEWNIKIFLANFFEKNLVGFSKSAKVPGATYDGDVMVVVGSNYKNVVLNEEKDVLIEWYSPYCGHCTHFAPTYQELAGKLKDVEGLIIAKIDATVNEVDGVPIMGYPTVMFYPRGKKNAPLTYQHGWERTVEALTNWMKTEGTAL